jgi:hypothetical protein
LAQKFGVGAGGGGGGWGGGTGEVVGIVVRFIIYVDSVRVERGGWIWVGR